MTIWLRKWIIDYNRNKMEKMANTNITIFQENMKKENKCEICEKVFKTKAKLKVHYHNVHANNEKIG